jgi:hypothetical protein
MFEALQNTFISFFVMFQGFWGRNPKYKTSNVNGVGWLHDLNEHYI